MKKNVFYLFVLFSFIVSCNGNSVDDGNQSSTGTTNGSDGVTDGTSGGTNENSGGYTEWSIPIEEVMDGGPGKDGIPSIDNPVFVNADDAAANFLNDDDLVVGIVKNNEARAYPHVILDWHEIVNDRFNGEFIAINYCPLTGTAFSWNKFPSLEIPTFGVSGLLYNTNLILYDRETDSNWSQLKLQCVNGLLIGDEPMLSDVVETTWGIWKELYPGTKLLSLDTGFNRDYGNYPYGPYITNNDYFLFPVSPMNSSLPNKERIYAIIDNEQSKVYRFSSFTNGNVVKESFQGKEYLIVGNENLINAFQLTGTYSSLEFNYSFNGSEGFFNDNEGNEWSIFGEAISGPRTGETLTDIKSVVSYWFAIAAFYPNPDIYYSE